MGLWLLANTFGYEAAEMRFTNFDSIDHADDADDGGMMESARGGPRSLGIPIDLPGGNNRLLSYVNTNNSFTPPTHFVGVDFTTQLDATFKLLEWNDTLSGYNEIYEQAPFEGPLVGIDYSDFVVAFVPSAPIGAYSVKLSSGTYTARQLYLCAGLEFEAQGPSLEFQKTPVTDPAVYHKGNWWKLYGVAHFAVTNVDAELRDAYQALPKDDAVFFYDDTGGDDYGDFIPHKLWHCLILEEQITQAFDDLYQIDFTVGLLKHGDG